jgi:hypothetical protein
VHAFDAANWTYFCAAMVGATAALTGLLFVSVSLNLDHILKGPQFLPQRAAEALASLLFVLSASAFVLVPQNIRLVGAEILVIVVPLIVVTLRSQLAYRSQQTDDPVLWLVSRMSATAMATVPGLLAGISLVTRWGGGLYWLVPLSILGIAGAVYNAWVLLVEIVR